MEKELSECIGFQVVKSREVTGPRKHIYMSLSGVARYVL